MIRVWLRLGLGLIAILTVSASLWSLAQNPFAQPYIARTEADIRARLDVALDRDLTPARVTAKIEDALARSEADKAAAILRLAEARGVAIADETRARLADATEATRGLRACLACAFDPAACANLTQVAQCNLPLELTPLGDVMAVNRALDATLSGAPVDRIDLSLGLLGLGATGAVVVTGGSSASVKAGATALRVARRTGALSASLARELSARAGRALDPDLVRAVLSGRAPLARLTGTPAMRALSASLRDLGSLARAMGPADSLAVLRYAGSARELSQIARVARVTGPDTRATFALLGKARVLRAAHRIADIVWLTLGLLGALAAQILGFLIWMIRRSVPARQIGAKT